MLGYFYGAQVVSWHKMDETDMADNIATSFNLC